MKYFVFLLVSNAFKTNISKKKAKTKLTIRNKLENRTSYKMNEIDILRIISVEEMLV